VLWQGRLGSARAQRIVQAGDHRPGCCRSSPSIEGAGRAMKRRGVDPVPHCCGECAFSRAPDRPLSSRYGDPELPIDSPGRRAPRGLSSIASDRFSVRDAAPSSVPDPPVSPPEAMSSKFVSSPGRPGLTSLMGAPVSQHSKHHAGRRPGIRKLGRLRTSLAPGTGGVYAHTQPGRICKALSHILASQSLESGRQDFSPSHKSATPPSHTSGL
jgi:hypothetical protein